MSSLEPYLAAGFMLLGLVVILAGNRGGKSKWVVYRLWAAIVLAVIGLSLLTLYLNGFYYF